MHTRRQSLSAGHLVGLPFALCFKSGINHDLRLPKAPHTIKFFLSQLCLCRVWITCINWPPLLATAHDLRLTYDFYTSRSKVCRGVQSKASHISCQLLDILRTSDSTFQMPPIGAPSFIASVSESSSSLQQIYPMQSSATSLTITHTFDTSSSALVAELVLACTNVRWPIFIFTTFGI